MPPMLVYLKMAPDDSIPFVLPYFARIFLTKRIDHTNLLYHIYVIKEKKLIGNDDHVIEYPTALSSKNPAR